ncbi:MAG: RdgB/HAM1 family non-canonical purine NTP pyrophosphatase [Defluviitaleaceae bacterium]|nr:RdgB/HAM1 family non-canonical purine NTP pyrophosphatase [Defluviitaleaceae bacterium]
MKKLVVATRNKGKVNEILRYLEGAAFGQSFSAVLSLDDVGLDLDLDAIENGTTFEENATKKAVAVQDILGDDYIVLADDSGLSIDALNGEPGVNSANFMGRDTLYPVRFEAILSQLTGDNRSARFVCVMAVADEEGVTLFRGEMEGEIAYQPAGYDGFGYDPIFYLPDYGKTSAELTMEQKNAISHRGKALKAVIEGWLNEPN